MKPAAIVLMVALAGIAAFAAPGPVSAQVHYLEITIPVETGLTPALRPPIAMYEWQTLSGSADPAEVRWILVPAPGNDFTTALDYIRNTPGAPEWSPWTPYAPPGTGTSWTTPPVDFGPYVFAVQGRDASGVPETEFDLSRNARAIRVSNRLTGPILTVDGDLIDPIVTAITTTPPVEIDVPAGTPVVFCWTADASEYGGVVTGYRYGWDIIDPDDPEQWETPFLAFPQPTVCSNQLAFNFGTHTFMVEVIDNDGYKSRAVVELTIVGPPVSTEEHSWGSVKAIYRE